MRAEKDLKVAALHVHKAAMTCDEIQLTMEKEARGLVDERARERLSEHVRDCEDCRRMRALIGAMGSLEPPTTPPLRVLLARRRRRALAGVGLVVGTGLALAAAAFFIHPFDHALRIVLLGAVLIAWIVVQVRARDARLLRLAKDRGAFMAALRLYLEDELRAASGARVSVGALVLLGAGTWLWASGTVSVALVLLASAAWLLGLAIYLRYRRQPQLRAELEELGGKLGEP